MTALSNRVHFFAHPSVREELDNFFTEILGLPAAICIDAGGGIPILIYQFANGASLSVEITEEALSAEDARHGAWLELVAEDAPGLMNKVLVAGLPQLEYLGSDHFYFQAPGGQVMRIVSQDQR